MSKKMWEPSKQQVKDTRMYEYMQFVNERYGKNFYGYDELYNWSVTSTADFWASLWDYLEVIHSRPYEYVVDDATKMPGATWFEGARLNFAENLLRYRDDRPAIKSAAEWTQNVKTMTHGELYRAVAKAASTLRKMDIQPGDRVVGYMPNIAETVIFMLAAASVGAVWSCCSPDFGKKGVLDRFGQVRPRVLVTTTGYYYNGKPFSTISNLKEFMPELDSVEKVVVIPYAEIEADIDSVDRATWYNDFIDKDAESIEFTQLPFYHPLYIMYSSGTTGLPKCMVHGAGGILLNQLKELVLHTDVKRDDLVFYYTTTGWMMWNWLVASIGAGASVLLFDGSPFYPDPGVLFRLAEGTGMTVFGTSARYIAALEQNGMEPAKDHDLSSIKAILSTGSPLAEESFDYVYNRIKENVCLSSISGGSDINGCFALGNPMGPVYRGELQCRGLGMKVEAFDENGKPVRGKPGELVCTAPFPSMPIYFWNDESGEKYHNAYFDVYPGVWCHGDFIMITEHNGVIIYGRSDATLNPGGVRIGTAEIYSALHDTQEVADSLVVGQQWDNDTRVVLFVKLNRGYRLDDELKKRIRKTIRENASPRHVPAKIIEVDDIPYTITMKKVELAVRNIIHGKPVTNRDALMNPESLDLYHDLPELEEE
ncbi:MAG: acetoacetate--CoA ligase [Spirochaetota bacterium]